MPSLQPSPALEDLVAPLSAQERLEAVRELGHDLRTPLSAILGFSELLSREHHGPIGAEAYREYAEIIRESGLQLLDRVNAMLARAAAEAVAPER